MTLEAAARDAGVSKGGLLYHFASKEALLTAMMARLAGQIAADFEAVVAAEPAGIGRTARAMLVWAFEEPGLVCEHQDRAAAVFLAAFHHDRALLDPVRAIFAEMRRQLAEDGLPPGVGQAILCATDGLFLAHTFGMYTLRPDETADLRGALTRLLESAP